MRPSERPWRRDGGNAMTEYVILLVLLAISLVGIVVKYGYDLDAEWRNTDDSTGPIDDVASDLSDEGCNFYFNPATGRWHDPDTHLFVSFDEAEAAGC